MKRADQKLIAGPIDGYKMLNEDMSCSPNGNRFVFQMGMNELPGDEPLELCKHGFHFCPHPSGVWSYYPTGGRLFKVRAYDVLEQPAEPGAVVKMVCARVELLEEVSVGGHRNTGHRNTGGGNTGNWNTGDRNTGDGNTGHRNTGHRNTGGGNTGHRNTGGGNTGNWNTGDGNTGHWNTGDRNTGDGNTGDGNTGDGNTGHWNTGDGNCGSFHSGFFNLGDAPLYMFGRLVKGIERKNLNAGLIQSLCAFLARDEAFDPTPFLALPNATAKKIKALHAAHIKARKEKK